ncbi:major facilitator superfamily domain-containing protein [Morchella snyderi]|nr:major facilitator superfamily domain-containing protein [Morchella snyderi]
MSLFNGRGPAFHIELESIPPVHHKQPVRHATTPGYTETDPEELRKLCGPSASGFQTPKTEPTTPSALGSSRPPMQAVGLMPSVNSPSINRWRLLAACMLIFTNGVSDAAPGALIPYMEKHYSIGYAVVSLIFLANAVGFITAAFISQAIYSRIGRARTLLIGVLLLAAAFLTISCTPPWGMVVASYFLIGAGMAFMLAQCNVFCSSLQNSTTLFGYVHGSYGVGGTISPLIATAMASRGIKWSHFYLILLGLSVVNAIFVPWVFKGSEKDSPTPEAVQIGGSAMSKGEVLKKSLKNKYVLSTSLFIFAYQGAEVAIGGWTVSFLIASRNGDPGEVGYVVSGFWAGITLGRFALSPVCHRFGEKRSVYCLILGSALFQVLVWTVPSIISNAVFVIIVGILLGPIYPCTMTIATRLIDNHLLVSSLSLISAIGSSGGAVAPFTTGLLASRFGAWVLHPVSIGLFVVMEGIWWTLPTVRKRSE